MGLGSRRRKIPTDCRLGLRQSALLTRERIAHENRILPPQADAPKETPAGNSTAAPAVAPEPSAAQPGAGQVHDGDNGAPPDNASQSASGEGDMVVDATSRPAVSVNGAAKAEGDA